MATPMSQTNSHSISWDIKRYNKAPPYEGTKGVAFENWERHLVAGIADLGDDDAALEDTLYGLDPGGDDATIGQFACTHRS